MINYIARNTKENNKIEWIIDSGCPINLTNEIKNSKNNNIKNQSNTYLRVISEYIYWKPYSVFIMLTTKKQENQQNIYFLIGNSPISWKSQLQKCATLSATEVELVSLTELRKLLEKLFKNRKREKKLKQFEELEEDKYIDPDMPKCEYCKGVRYMPMMVYEGLHTSDFVSGNIVGVDIGLKTKTFFFALSLTDWNDFILQFYKELSSVNGKTSIHNSYFDPVTNNIVNRLVGENCVNINADIIDLNYKKEWDVLFNNQNISGDYSKTPFLVRSVTLFTEIMPMASTCQWLLSHTLTNFQVSLTRGFYGMWCISECCISELGFI
ncbi:hypothetical protein H8356DRAFT_1424945 [Neocallimastix lanati (nom. inval.)]|nr:hypothetical protein H8356DRAFT_1424945 [Neocallimastix sp. JGI-2020a]